VHKLRTSCVLHDASYVCALELFGGEGAIGAALARVSEVPESLLRGMALGEPSEHALMLHSCGKQPEEPLCPATAAVVPCGDAGGSSERSVCLWVHCAAAKDAAEALSEAVQGTGAQARSITNRLRRLELRGQTASEVLQRGLRGAAGTAGKQQGAGVGPAEKADGVAHGTVINCGDSAAHGTVINCSAYDPRLLKPVTAANRGEDGATEEEPKASQLPGPPEGPTASLWGGPIPEPPPSEADISKHRRLLRRKALHLGAAQCDQAADTGDLALVACPMALVRHRHDSDPPGSCTSGWSIILPAGWVKPFWMALVMAGAHAAGLREWEWYCAEAGLAAFPRDFPDTRAGRDFAEASWDGERRRGARSGYAPSRWRVARAPSTLRRCLQPETHPVDRCTQGDGDSARAGPAIIRMVFQRARPWPPGENETESSPEVQLRAYLRPSGKGRPLPGAVLYAPPPSSMPGGLDGEDASGALGDPVGVVTSEGLGGVGQSGPWGASCLCSSTAVARLRASLLPSTWRAGASLPVMYVNLSSDAPRKGRLNICLELHGARPQWW